ncbi:hypothetical protein ACIOKD_17305 [Streptomyces sp. NPDC087844]|uniref:hypothetical protein n=1 Tax=Streptomyces sp. NPDC087844 TaxID=3365805 RepID=UPI0037F46E16
MITHSDDGPDFEPDDPLAVILRPASDYLGPPPGRYEAIRRGAARRRLLRAAAGAGLLCAVTALVALPVRLAAPDRPVSPTVPLAPPSTSSRPASPTSPPSPETGESDAGRPTGAAEATKKPSAASPGASTGPSTAARSKPPADSAAPTAVPTGTPTAAPTPYAKSPAPTE